MSEFTAEARRLLSEAAAQHRLRCVDLDDGSVALVGTAHAVVVAGERVDVLVFYVERGRDGELLAYNVGTWIDARFTSEDRAAFGSPHTIAERAMAALRVVAGGLTRRCQDVLGGDRGWLDALQRRDPDSWRPLKFVPSRDVLARQLGATGARAPLR